MKVAPSLRQKRINNWIEIKACIVDMPLELVKSQLLTIQIWKLDPTGVTMKNTEEKEPIMGKKRGTGFCA